MPQVDYKALNRPAETNLNSSATNLRESINWLLKSFTQTIVYERYNVVLCCITTLCGFVYMYHVSFLVFLQVFLCCTLLFDMVANIQSNDINYILTSKYYRDMGLFIMNMVILSLVSICDGYGMRLGMSWIRIQLFCHEIKYLPPSVIWALHTYKEVGCPSILF
ncbi:hypothetical protein WA588_004219 [Blastocystis sp. NMH]